jgi:hypothetical protein
MESCLDRSYLDKSAKTLASLLFYEFNTPGLSRQRFLEVLTPKYLNGKSSMRHYKARQSKLSIRIWKRPV